MKRFALVLAFTYAVSSAFIYTFAAAQAAPAAQDAISVLRASAKLVVVDVVVTDSQGNFIPGLHASDFTLDEGKTPQLIRSFEEHGEPATIKLAALPPQPPGVFTNYTSAPVNSAVNVLLLDLLNTPMEDQNFVRNQLVEYLKSVKPGTRIAIFSLTAQLRMLQGFTTDSDLLLRAIQTVKAKASPLLDNPGGAGAAASLADQVSSDLSGASVGNPNFLTNLYDFEAETKTFQIKSRAQDTLTAMNELALYLTGLPNRKNLLWFSGAFPLNILPDADAKGSAFASIGSVESDFRATTNLLTRAQVSVYPIDALGVRTSAFNRASSGDMSRAGGSGGFSNGEALTNQRSFTYDTIDAHNAMNAMAEDTGGKAYINTNGLAEAARSAIANGSRYYTLSYSPSNVASDGVYRPIKVKLDHPGAKLSYRHGYYAEAPATGKSAAAAAAPSSLRAASVFGGPNSTQIIFKSLVQPISAKPEANPAQGNEVNGKTEGPWNRYAVNYAADVSHMGLDQTPDGHYKGTVRFIAMIYKNDGTLVNSTQSVTKIDVSAADYLKLVQGGLHIAQQVSAPVKGTYSMRLVVHDQTGDKVGSIEIPVAGVASQLSADPSHK